MIGGRVLDAMEIFLFLGLFYLTWFFFSSWLILFNGNIFRLFFLLYFRRLNIHWWLLSIQNILSAWQIFLFLYKFMISHFFLIQLHKILIIRNHQHVLILYLLLIFLPFLLIFLFLILFLNLRLLPVLMEYSFIHKHVALCKRIVNLVHWGDLKVQHLDWWKMAHLKSSPTHIPTVLCHYYILRRSQHILRRKSATPHCP